MAEDPFLRVAKEAGEFMRENEDKQINCAINGCRRLKWVCEDCGRTASTAEFAKREWISVSERLPEDDQTVLGWQNERESNLPIICWYDKDRDGFVPCFSMQDYIIKLDCWMELPEPPMTCED